MKYIKQKPKMNYMSIIACNKYIEIIDNILSSNLAITIYGNIDSDDSRVCKNYNQSEPYDNYIFTVVHTMEQHDMALMHSSIPIGIGDVYNIQDSKDGLALITNILSNPLGYVIDIEKQRCLLYNDDTITKQILNENKLLITYELYNAVTELTCVYKNDDIGMTLIHITKNGSSSLRDMFNLKYAKYEHNCKNKTVVFIRNPMTRIVSSFTQILKTNPRKYMAITRNSEFYKNRNNIEKSFELFLDFIKDNFYDVHIYPQVAFLRQKNLKPEDIDYVFDFDDFASSVQTLKTVFNGKGMIHKNKKRFTLDMSKYEHKIREIYNEDFELYDQVTRK